MKIIVFNPLGWKSNIWNKIKMPEDTIFIEFDHSGYQEIFDKCVDLLNNLDDKYCVITSSYGTQFFLELSNHIDCNLLNKLYILDGLEQIPNQEILASIADSRLDKFDTKEQYLSHYLSTDDQLDSFKVDLIHSIFTKENNQYVHFLSNQMFVDYLSNISINSLEVLSNIKCPIDIYTSADIDIPHTKITPEEHLVMIERTDIITKILADIKE